MIRALPGAVPVLRPVAMGIPVAVARPVIVVIGAAVASGRGGRIAHDPQHGGRNWWRHPGRDAGTAITSPRVRPAAGPCQ